MEIDVNSFVTRLREVTKDIQNASRAIQEDGPMAAMSFVPGIMQNLKDLKEYGTLEGISKSSESGVAICDAIEQLLLSAKEVEKAAPQAAALFGSGDAKIVRDNLWHVLKELDEERGKKIKGIDEGAGV